MDDSPEALGRVMPATINGRPVVSAFRHMPEYGSLRFTFTVIYQEKDEPRESDGLFTYTIGRALWDEQRQEWCMSAEHGPSHSGLHWQHVRKLFHRFISLAGS